MNVVKKIGKGLLFGLGFLTAWVFILALVIWIFPALLVTNKNLERTSHFLKGKGIVITWRTIDVHAKSASFLKKQLSLKATDLCYGAEEEPMRACFGSADLLAAFSLKAPAYQVDHLVLAGGDVTLRPTPAKKEAEKEKSPSTELWPRAPKFLESMTFQSIDVAVDKLRYFLEDGSIQGKARLIGKAEGKGAKFDVQSDAVFETKDKPYALKAKIDLASKDSLWFGPYVIDGDASANLPGKQVGWVKIHGVPDKDATSMTYAIEGDYRQRKERFVGKVSGVAGKKSIEALINMQAQGLVPQLAKITAMDCKVQLKPQNPEGTKSQLLLNCPVSLVANREVYRGVFYEEILREMKLLVNLKVDREDKGEKRGSLTGELAVLVDPLLQRAKEGNATLSTKFTGNALESPSSWQFDSNLDLNIPHFETLVAVSHKKPWAVPAPLNHLKGSVVLKVSGKGDLAKLQANLPVTLTTRLSAQDQVMNIDGKGALSMGKKADGTHTHLGFEVTLANLKLILPELAQSSPPQLLPDSRINPNPKKEAASAFTYDIKILTPQQQPLRLVSNLVKQEVPIAVDVRLQTGQDPKGFVRVAGVPVEMFRRVAQLKHLNLLLTGNSEATAIDGLIQVAYTDYTVFVMIEGKASEPQIKFRSEPPLPEDQVLAVLLFGRKMDALDSNESSSVGNTKAAIADSAISLASMYLLASTPVESVGFDPFTHEFKAKLKLADGTSLNVGTDMKALSEIGIRKRLGPHWSVTTYLENPLSPLGQSVTAFLEWSKAY